jgi:dihydroorotate dehydrogenase electron transfer subunit
MFLLWKEDIVRLSLATITANTALRPGVHLIEVHVPYLAQAAQPGQYCMVRCCHPLAHDPLLRRPFFIHGVQRAQGLCSLLVNVRGRGTAWLAQQSVGSALDILGPLGHGWLIRPTVRNMLLIGAESQIAALTLLAQVALTQDLAVTLLCLCSSDGEAYPPTLLPEEVEYHIVTGDLLIEAESYLNWADAACCSLPHDTLLTFYHRYERMRWRHFAQSILLQPLVCGSGICLTCNVETRAGQQLICRDGPVFAVREIAL